MAPDAIASVAPVYNPSPPATAACASAIPRVLFCTRYVDHIQFALLGRLRSNATVQVLCSTENDWTKRLASAGHLVRILRPRSRFDSEYKALVSRMYTERPWDLVHCFHGNAELANLIRWAEGRIPIVAYRAYIGHLSLRENPLMYWSVRNPGLDAVVAVSGAVKRYLDSFRWLKPRNVRVISHGIDYEWMRSQTRSSYGLREKLGIGRNALIVGVMANLRPYKRFDLVIRAAEQLPLVHFVHLGDDHGWRQRTAHLRNVHFLGPIAEPWSIIAEADVFATTAHNEAFGRSNLEALACAKPLIGANSGGLLDLVEDGVNGRLFESTDAADFAAKILFYDRDRDAVRRHSVNAVHLVKGRLSADTMAANYADLYTDVLAARRARA